MAIQTSHVGSLPRSQKVVDYIFAREKGEDYNEIEFDQVMTEAVNDTVRKQKKAGITIVSDGETSKISYATYVKDRYHGFAGDSPRNAPADLKKFPNYLQKLANDGGTPKYARPMCVSKLEPKKNDDLIRITKADGYWSFVPKDQGVVVTYQMHADPGGSIPKWLVNRAVVDTPYDTLNQLRDYLKN